MSIGRFRVALVKAIERAGSQQRLADEVGVSQPHISQVMAGTAEPLPALVEALGFTVEKVYRKAPTSAAAA